MAPPPPPPPHSRLQYHHFVRTAPPARTKGQRCGGDNAPENSTPCTTHLPVWRRIPKQRRAHNHRHSLRITTTTVWRRKRRKVVAAAVVVKQVKR
jgi:hypothetical protein